MAFKHGNHTIADLNSNETEIRSPSNLVLYPTDNIWISQGTKLIFEGTIPDDYEAKLQANAVTADRDIILPDESGTLATQAYVTSAVSSGNISDTDALAEGTTNLYYTDARADARATLRINAATTDNISEGTTNLYYTTARANTDFDTQLGTKTTTDLAEGTNLYYTDARADARITNALGGNVTIGGNLTVSGTTTTVNSNTVNIGDSIITLNSDETGAPSQNGGIEIERGTSTNVQLRFNETSDAWEFTNDGTTYIALGTASTFSGNSDGVTEGSTNLFYTDARSRSAISVAGDLSYNSSTGVISFTETAQDFAYASLTGAPTNVSTFTNDSGYITGYTVTQGDVTAHQAALSITQSQISDLDHYTDADVDAHLSGGTGVNYASGVISIGQGVSTSSHVQFHCIGVGTPASTTQGEIRATADVTAYYSSDAKLKENVINITNALEKVQQIRGVEFDWKQEYIDARGGEDDYFIRKHDVGVIAQEVEAVLPEVVGTRADGTKAVKYDRITSLLIEAIKEQQSQIDQLKAIIEELKNK